MFDFTQLNFDANVLEGSLDGSFIEVVSNNSSIEGSLNGPSSFTFFN